MGTAIIIIIAVLIGYWLGKGNPIPTINKTVKEPIKEITEEEIQELEKQKELQQQFEKMLNYNGSVGRYNDGFNSRSDI